MITNNAKQIILPEDLKQAIEKVRVQLSVNQHELLILKKTRVFEQGVVEHLIRDRQFLTEKKAELEKEVKEKAEYIEQVNKVIESKQAEFDEISLKVTEAETTIKEAEKKKTEIDEYVAGKEKEIEEKIKEFSNKEIEILNKEKQAEQKLLDIKQFLTTI